jgi:hypothetical protein
MPVSRPASGSYSFFAGTTAYPSGKPRLPVSRTSVRQDQPEAVDEAVLRLAKPNRAKPAKLAPLLAAGIVGDADQGAVGKTHAAAVAPAREPPTGIDGAITRKAKAAAPEGDP